MSIRTNITALMCLWAGITACVAGEWVNAAAFSALAGWLFKQKDGK